MTLVYLADAAYAAAVAGRIVGMLVLPVGGLILLIIEIRKRSAARRQSPVGYPPGYRPPPGYPPNYPTPGQPGHAAYPPGRVYRLPSQPLQPPPRPKSAGTGLIVTGIIL